MAKVYEILELLAKAGQLAEKESEKLDFVNQVADFCETSGMYFDTDDYFDLERSVVETIEYGNSWEYDFEDFGSRYNNVVDALNKFKNKYFDHYDNSILISFAICTYGNEEMLKNCLSSLFKYPRNDIEAVVLDCSGKDNIKDICNDFKPNKIEYFKSDKSEFILQEKQVIEHCTGKFIFPVYENNSIASEFITQLISIIKNNPKVSSIHCPRRESMQYTAPGAMWEIIDNSDERYENVLTVEHKTGFGFSKELYNKMDGKFDSLEVSREEFYTGISVEISDAHEIAIFYLPIYFTESDKI